MDLAAPLHCQNCGTLNDSQNNMTGIPACASCGLTSTEGAFSMQDELSKLFERGMTFAPMQLPSASQHRQQWQPEPQETPSPEVRPALGYSASQHYIPVTRPVEFEQQAAEQPTDQLPLACQQLLIQHGISPESLSAEQRSLFLYATPDQRDRLIDLWATYNQVQGHILATEAAMDHDVPPVNVSADANDGIGGTCSAEPYITSGYETQGGSVEQKKTFSPLGSAVGNENEYKQAIDPVYKGFEDRGSTSNEWWGHGGQEQRPSEFQYGMFEAMRQYHIPIEDEEML